MEQSRIGNQQDINAKIIGLMKIRGPILPIHASKETNLSLLLTGAFLSTLFSEKVIKISNMKVGGSPLYFLPGQEPLLENFTKFLNHKEREAYSLLKERKVLQDDKLTPDIRVAIRNIKDFASSFSLNQNPGVLYWRFFTVNDEELEKELEKLKEKPEIKPEPPKQEEVKVEQKPEKKIEVKLKEEIKEKVEKKPKQKKEKTVDIKFLEEVKSFLLKKDIELMQEIAYSKSEVIAKVRINSDLGKISLILIAKDKRKISESDIILAYQKATEAKMPCLFLARAEVTKKLQEILEPYKNLLKIEKI